MKTLIINGHQIKRICPEIQLPKIDDEYHLVSDGNILSIKHYFGSSTYLIINTKLSTGEQYSETEQSLINFAKKKKLL
ncbi:MAG: hypothetical protein H8D45_28510 [Bacteroidetes bacterium]|nr:hypothetical protein [Bacteroidota bacterium]